jgi:hypothetical protein
MEVFMNIVFLSPHFPPNYYQFCVQLRNLGATVLGLSDEPYDFLRSELKNALNGYYKVNNMHDYDELVRACGYFTYKYGKIDRIDSLNEYWLESEGKLRLDFNIPGLKGDQLTKVKRKSLMKQVFQEAGVPVARGQIVHTLTEARRLIKETGYPVVAKPDIGVGAARTYKIHGNVELNRFFEQKPVLEYIMEEFIDGSVLTYDGLVNGDGRVVFENSLIYNQGIMEAVNQDNDIYYFTERVIPKDLKLIGKKILKAFDVKERFFHFEFFRRSEDNSLVALEVNMRPPGGLTTDMFNYANDIDIYREWANVIVNNNFTTDVTHKYYCAYIGRKNHFNYAHDNEEIMAQFSDLIVYQTPISGIFSAALGDYGFLARSPRLNKVLETARFIQEKA